MRLWILVGCGVLILGAAIWPLRSPKPPAMPHVAPAVAARPQQTEPPKPVPAKVVEVIDLARAYEPVREPEEPDGTVNPASLIQVPDGPRRIPAAVDVDGTFSGIVRLAGEIDGGWDRIDIQPREVTWPMQIGPCWYIPLLHGPVGFIPGPVKTNDGLIAIRSCVILPGDTPPMEYIYVMPREVSSRACQEERERSTGVREDDFVGVIGP